MIVAVKTREFKRDLDYDWEDYFPSDKALVSEAGTFHRALEGADDNSRFVALFRPAAGVGVTLGVSVSTTREDAVGRPLRTIAFLRATDAKETALLTSFFAECLRKKDAETLRNPKSGIAKAVESLYQTKKTDEFLAFCESLKPVDGKGGAPEDRWAIPRNDEGERKSLADALPAAITGDSPFLFALTDRLPTDVLASLGSMFDRGTVWIFSEATTVKEPIPGGPSNTRAVAAAIGGTILLALLVAVRGCSNAGETIDAKGGAVCKASGAVCQASGVESQVDGGGNAQGANAPDRSPDRRPEPEIYAPQVEPSPSPLTTTADAAGNAAEGAADDAKGATDDDEAGGKAADGAVKADEPAKETGGAELEPENDPTDQK